LVVTVAVMPAPSNWALVPEPISVVHKESLYSLTVAVPDAVVPVTAGVEEVLEGDAGVMLAKLGAEGPLLLPLLEEPEDSDEEEEEDDELEADEEAEAVSLEAEVVAAGVGEAASSF
jgi:hypothetical protein